MNIFLYNILEHFRPVPIPCFCPDPVPVQCEQAINPSGEYLLSYLSSSTVIVQIHQGPIVFINLPRIDEDPREVQSVFNVCAAAAPLPAVRGELPLQLVLIATAAREVPRGARLRYGVSNAG